jgi:type IX secretion system PorP/SprF family membrane protein
LKYPEKKLLFTCFLYFLALPAIAQQLPLYSQYMMSGFLINPAIAGSDGYTTASLTSRDHWSGLKDSPKTFALSLQTRVLWQKSSVNQRNTNASPVLTRRSGRVGLGAYVFKDRNALIDRTGAQITYAYHIFIQNTQLSFGLAASAFQFKINQDRLDFRDAEPVLADGFNNLVFVPDFTCGIYVLDQKNFLGVSVAQLFQTSVKIGNDNLDYKMKRHFYIIGGHRIMLSNDSEIEPSVMIKGSEIGFVQADFTFKYFYKEFYWAGLSYRTQSSIGLLIGGRAKKFFIGYAFDYNLSDIQKYSFGSHELNLAMKFGDNVRRYRWLIRY